MGPTLVESCGMFAVLSKAFCSPVDTEHCVTSKTSTMKEDSFATESGVLDRKTMADMGWVDGKTGMQDYVQ